MTVAQLASGAGASQGASCAWPPTGPSRPANRLVVSLTVQSDHLTLPVGTYQQGAMAFGTLRSGWGLWSWWRSVLYGYGGPVHYSPESYAACCGRRAWRR